jgi:hypothetical protein
MDSGTCCECEKPTLICSLCQCCKECGCYCEYLDKSFCECGNTKCKNHARSVRKRKNIMTRRNILKTFISALAAFYLPFKAKATISDMNVIEMENGEIKNLDYLRKNFEWDKQNLKYCRNGDPAFYSTLITFLPEKYAVQYGCSCRLFWGKVKLMIWEYPDFLSVSIVETTESSFIRTNQSHYIVPINCTKESHG